MTGRSDRSVLPSRVGRRITTLFVVCALIPLAGFALVSLILVSTQLREEADRNLRQAAKASCMTLVEQLITLDTDLRLVADELRRHRTPINAHLPAALRERLAQRFTGVHLLRPEGRIHLVGSTDPEWDTAPADLEHLRLGKSVIRTSVTADPPTQRVLMAQALDADDPAAALIVGTLASERLWHAEGVEPLGGEILILDEAGATLFASAAVTSAAGRQLRTSADRTARGNYTWSVDGQEYLASYRRLFMRPRFGTNWIVVLSRPQEEVLRPLIVFERLFVLTAVLTFLIVAAMSLSQIRRTLTPISLLHQATRRVAQGNFSTKVELHSKDEFEDLGASFNSMLEGLVENIQRREQTERELVDARDAALAAARREADFLCSVSHELRTPLTSIVSYSELLTDFDDESPATRREFIEILGIESKRLMRMIDEILQFRDLRDGRTRHLAAIDLRLNLETAIADLPAEQQGRIQVMIPVDLPIIEGDPDLLRQTWTHLLSNAATYSAAAAPVTVTATARGDKVMIEVVDQGPGIAPEHRDAIFERFFQINSDILTAKNGGTGLGLALVKEIVEHHGGRIELDSEVGVGSTFRVILDMQAAHAATPGAQASRPTAPAGALGPR